MQVTAKLRNHRVSARKARLVADMVRGRQVEEALAYLDLSPKKFARPLAKLVRSAVANAEHNEGADIDELKVATIMVDEGPTFKRGRARAKGRGTRILKRNSHITVTVADDSTGQA